MVVHIWLNIMLKNHYYGARNPYAQFQKEITMEDYLKSKPVAYPLKLLSLHQLQMGSSSNLRYKLGLPMGIFELVDYTGLIIMLFLR